jgi:hypothetical protein
MKIEKIALREISMHLKQPFETQLRRHAQSKDTADRVACRWYPRLG